MKSVAFPKIMKEIPNPNIDMNHIDAFCLLSDKFDNSKMANNPPMDLNAFIIPNPTAPTLRTSLARLGNTVIWEKPNISRTATKIIIITRFEFVLN